MNTKNGPNRFAPAHKWRVTGRGKNYEQDGIPPKIVISKSDVENTAGYDAATGEVDPILDTAIEHLLKNFERHGMKNFQIIAVCIAVFIVFRFLRKPAERRLARYLLLRGNLHRSTTCALAMPIISVVKRPSWNLIDPKIEAQANKSLLAALYEGKLLLYTSGCAWVLSLRMSGGLAN